MKRAWTRQGVAAAALCAALMTLMPLPGSLGHAAAATYELVENWAQLPPGIKWSSGDQRRHRRARDDLCVSSADADHGL